MLFINNHQAQVFEFHIFLDELMGTDDNVYLSVCESCKGLGLFLGGAEAGQFRNFYRPLVRNQTEAIGKILKVLLGQQGGWQKNRHLPPVRYGYESGTQRHRSCQSRHPANQPSMGLPISDLGYSFNSGCLIGSFLKAEAFGERVIIPE